MDELRNRIKSEYFNYLSEFERNNFDNYLDEDIPFLLNIIWDNYLKNNKVLLVLSITNIFMDNYDKIEDIIKDHKKFKLISYSAKNIEAGEYGFIVNIDWSTSNQLYLPEDLIQAKNINAKMEIMDIFLISVGLGELDYNYDIVNSLKELNEKQQIKILSIYDFNPNYKINIDHVISNTISLYLYFRKDHLNVELQTMYEKKYRKYILKKLKKYLLNDSFDDSMFMKEITDYIDSKEKIVTPKL